MDNYDRFSLGKPKKLPMAHSERDQFLAYLELLSLTYEESSILPVLLEVKKTDDQDYLSQKYIDLVEPLMLEVKGEVIFPEIDLFDSHMIVLNYRKFYSF